MFCTNKHRSRVRRNIKTVVQISHIQSQSHKTQEAIHAIPPNSQKSKLEGGGMKTAIEEKNE